VTQQSENPRGASAESIRLHYDSGNDFYALWLDPSLTYSCAAWEPGDTLETAQARKLDLHARNAIGDIGQAGAVLDIGCGWGSMLRRLVRHHGVERVVGLTLSDAQAWHIGATPDERIAVRRESWEVHSPREPYDGIVSIGAFEHFVKPGLSSTAKIGIYREFFGHCHGWLRPGRSMSLQTICWNTPNEAVHRFLSSEIFPESDLPTVAEICAAVDGIFEVRRVTNEPEQYERTCKEWLRRLKERRREARAIAGEMQIARFEKYLGLCAIGFHRRSAGLLRLALRKID
jgi:cyclopropane-fatty-acyl-phospholipid synthase